MQIGYDRLLTLGDMTAWHNYDVSAEITIHSLGSPDYGVGIVVGWKGHSTLQYGVPLPDQPRTGHPFPGLGWYNYDPTKGPAPQICIWENTATNIETVMVSSVRTLALETKYNFRFRVQAAGTTSSTFSLKVWPSGTIEPAAFDLTATGDLSQGSVVLGSHRADVTFGNLSVTALP
jgi:hypothetical protein